MPLSDWEINRQRHMIGSKIGVGADIVHQALIEARLETEHTIASEIAARAMGARLLRDGRFSEDEVDELHGEMQSIVLAALIRMRK